MRAVVFDSPGGPEVLQESFNVTAPELGPDEVRIKVEAAGVNRAELMQRAGGYPAPPGASPILGLEATGHIVEVGSGVTKWKGGERVMALLNGGGYAEEAVAHEGHVLKVPADWSVPEAAGFMETTLTAFLNIFQIGGITEGQSVLIHGGGSGVGTQAIALCKAKGVTTFVTAGSDEKCAQCAKAGANFVINYRTERFAEVIREQTHGRGVNLILDCVGAPYLAPDIDSLATDGRLVFIGLQQGAVAEQLDLGLLLRKRLHVIGSTLRARSPAFKAQLTAALQEQFGDAMRHGKLTPIIDRVFPLADAADAHRRMAGSKHFGKIVLSVQSL